MESNVVPDWRPDFFPTELEHFSSDRRQTSIATAAGISKGMVGPLCAKIKILSPRYVGAAQKDTAKEGTLRATGIWRCKGKRQKTPRSEIRTFLCLAQNFDVVENRMSLCLHQS